MRSVMAHASWDADMLKRLWRETVETLELMTNALHAIIHESSAQAKDLADIRQRLGGLLTDELPLKGGRT